MALPKPHGASTVKKSHRPSSESRRLPQEAMAEASLALDELAFVIGTLEGSSGSDSFLRASGSGDGKPSFPMARPAFVLVVEKNGIPCLFVKTGDTKKESYFDSSISDANSFALALFEAGHEEAGAGLMALVTRASERLEALGSNDAAKNMPHAKNDPIAGQWRSSLPAWSFDCQEAMARVTQGKPSPELSSLLSLLDSAAALSKKGSSTAQRLFMESSLPVPDKRPSVYGKKTKKGLV